MSDVVVAGIAVAIVVCAAVSQMLSAAVGELLRFTWSNAKRLVSTVRRCARKLT
jgi:hypothetical protein